jgi:putative transposase
VVKLLPTQVATTSHGRYDKPMETELYEQWLMTYRKSAHSVYDLKVHLVWVTKYRYPVLTSEIGTRTREIIRQVCNQLNVQILSGHVSKDHVHLLVSVPPNLAVSQLVQKLKGHSSRKLLEEYSELKRRYWGRHLWARGYFAVSTGNVTDEIIKQYIESHDEKPNDETDNFSVDDDKL